MVQCIQQSPDQTALLSSEGKYTVFRCRGHVIRFRAPYSLERYTEVREWDRGYLVVMAKYRHNAEPEEEYIDLIPVLQDLYFDADAFLAPVREVKISYDRQETDCEWQFSGQRTGTAE